MATGLSLVASIVAQQSAEERTRIIIGAVDRYRADAHTVTAHISAGTRVTIIALKRIGAEHTPHLRIARVIGAERVIVTAERLPRALPTHAAVLSGARIPVVAARGVVHHEAARVGVTRVVGAHVTILTVNDLTDADTFLTRVIVCARIVVLTGLSVGGA